MPLNKLVDARFRRASVPGSSRLASRLSGLVGAALAIGVLAVCFPAAALAGSCSSETPALGSLVTCSTAGTDVVSAPAGAGLVNVVVVAGGGGGGTFDSHSANGGNGALVTGQVTLPAGTSTIHVTVGAGGAAGANGTGGSGGAGAGGGGSAISAYGSTGTLLGDMVIAGAGGGGGGCDIGNGGVCTGAPGTGGNAGADGAIGGYAGYWTGAGGSAGGTNGIGGAGGGGAAGGNSAPGTVAAGGAGAMIAGGMKGGGGGGGYAGGGGGGYATIDATQYEGGGGGGGSTYINSTYGSPTSALASSGAGVGGGGVVTPCHCSGPGATGSVSLTFGVSPPAVTTVAPASGPTAGGNNVVITGTNFTGATAVSVGGMPCGSFIVESATQINCLLPAGSAGSAAVQVTTPAGSGSLPAAYTYVAPPMNLTPPQVAGTAAQGQTLTATGDFWTGSPASFAYQWEDCDSSGANCVAISGATSGSYTLTAQDIGYTIEVAETATNAGGSATASSVPSDAVLPLAPTNTAPPQLTGTPTTGQALTATTGSWENNPTSYGYQWLDCDNSGDNCTVIAGATAGTYTLAASDAGYTVIVVVTATNAGGFADASSEPTGQVTEPGTPASPPGGGNGGVEPPPVILAAVPSTGVRVDVRGAVTLSLICPSTPEGCNASGVLTIELPKWLLTASRDSVIDDATGATSTVLASFSGVAIASGHTALIAVHVQPLVMLRLQEHRVRRVRVTLVISNHLTGGPAVNSTELVWLSIPRLFIDCPLPSGEIHGQTVGPVTLGSARAGLRVRLPRFTARNYHTDDFCLSAGRGIRVGWGSARLLGPVASIARAATENRAVLILTANPFYALDGVRPGTQLAVAAEKLHVGRRHALGLNDWYVIPGASSNGVLKVRHGVVQEVGIANRELTNTRARQVRLLIHF